MTSPQTAIVTGAASGIGLALVKHLLSKNYRVVLSDVNESKGQSLSQELGDNAIFYKADVSSWEEQASMFKHAWKWSGGNLTFLAANAGELMRRCAK